MFRCFSDGGTRRKSSLLKFKQPVRPGDTITYDVKVEKIRSNIVKASGIALVDEVKVAEASFTFCIADK